MKMTETEARTRLAEGRLYDPGQEGILEEQRRRMEILYDYNATRPSETGRRAELLGKMLAEAGENCYIEPPFHANFGGGHVHFGNNVYANFNLTVVDDAHVYVGDDVQIGPNVTIATAGHPLDPAYRRTGMQFAVDIHIGDGVWIGAGSILLPGVSVGAGSVIGAGSVVTRDIPAGVLAAGNPCRVLREIGERDREYYYKDRRVDVGEE